MSKFIECLDNSTNLEVCINVDNILYIEKCPKDDSTAIYLYPHTTGRPLVVKGSYSELMNKISFNNLSK